MSSVAVLFVATAKPGKEAELKALFASLITGSRHDPGNLLYELHEVQADPATIVLYEWWTSEEMLKAHLESKPLLALKAKVGELMVGRFEDGQRRLQRLSPAGDLS